jgi:hypothetical protein
MDSATPRTPSAWRPFFEDGLGKRYHSAGPGGEPLDLLVLRDEFAAIPSFESALRDRVSAFTAFQHPSYARTRGVARVGERTSALAVASDRVPGVRLSNVLATVEQQLLPLDLNATMCAIRQLACAVAMLHERMPGIAHGAIAPERIVIASDGQLVIVDHVFAPALEQLHLSPEQYWNELRLPLSRFSIQPRLDQRTDVLQLGMVALALILGRPLRGDDYPEKVGALAELAAIGTATGRVEPVPALVRAWLARTLQLDARETFASAVEAWGELEQILSGDDDATSFSSLRALMAGYAPAAPPVAPAAPIPTPQRVDAVSSHSPVLGLVSASAEADAPARRLSEQEAELHVTTSIPWWRRRSVAAAVVFVALACGGAFAGRWYLVQPAAAEASGTLAIDTNPRGVAVVVDNQPRGFTPVTLALAAGSHVVELLADGGTRTIPLTITPGGTVSQFIELPKVAVLTGQLQVRTEPLGARVSVDDVPHGVSPLVVEGLAPGTHIVELVNDAGSVRQEVIVHAGATATLVVPMITPQRVAASGWISIVAPVDVQVYENQRLLGSSRIERIMVPTGRHELEIVNEPLGYRSTVTVNVSADKVSPVQLDWPTGLIAINAQPWAEVWIAGQRIGETPIGRLALPVGPHDVVLRHPEFGERVVHANVTLTAPTRLSVDLRKQ